MIGFRKYVGLSALLVFGVGYHAVSTREQCDLQPLLLAAFQCSLQAVARPFAAFYPQGSVIDPGGSLRAFLLCKSSGLHAKVLLAGCTVTPTYCLGACRFFPAMHYLSTSKIAIAVTGNFAFAMALCLYHLLTAVCLLCPQLVFLILATGNLFSLGYIAWRR